MTPAEFLKVIYIDDYAATPKYLQVANAIIEAIEDEKLKKDDILPSINELSYMLEISRDTAEKGYKYLKNAGVIISVPGRGFFVSNTSSAKKIKVFLLFNKLSAHKKIIYDSLVNALGPDALVDFYIYNNNYSIFKKLIQNRRTDYSHYVIIPHFLESGDIAHDIINTLPKEKLILLDKKIAGIEGEFGAVYESFEQDIYNALTEAICRLEKYDTLKLIFPEKSYFPKEIIKGFRRFCQQYAFNHEIVNNIGTENLAKGEVYINLMEDDLVILIEKVMEQNLVVGKDIGIISYNETPLKKLILKGITTISTDFVEMGTMTADLILNKKIEQNAVPFHLRLRPSL